MKYLFSKILFFLVVFTYVFSSVGICLVGHYCGGSLEDVALFSKPASCCGDDVNESDGCCSNDSKHIVFQKDFTFSNIVCDYKVPVKHLFIMDHTRFYQFQIKNVSYSLSLVNKKNHPPNLVQQEIVLSSVLRI